jgi:hypothetical protein
MSTCYNCGTTTSNPKFCSRSCSAKATNKVPKRKAKPRYCKSCGCSASQRKTLCDPCRAPQDITLGEAIYTKHHKSSAFSLVRSRARASVSDRKMECEECGYSRHVEVCHVKPIGSYPHSAFLSEINAPSNLKLLCPNCHWEFDHP